MKNFSVIVLVASVSFIAGVGVTYMSKELVWISDMANQPSVKPQESPMRPPERAVPTNLMGGPTTMTGESNPAAAGHPDKKDQGHPHDSSAGPGHHHGPSPAHEHGSKESANPVKKSTAHEHGPNTPPGHHHDEPSHSHGPSESSKAKQKSSQTSAPHAHDQGTGQGHAHGAHASMNMPLVTPTPVKATPESREKGQGLFNIYCAVCHGTEGKGGTPMEKALAGIPKFTPQLLRSVSDTHAFSMLTSGHGPMPGYAEALTPVERWHVINYLRSIQNTPARRNPGASAKGVQQ